MIIRLVIHSGVIYVSNQRMTIQTDLHVLARLFILTSLHHVQFVLSCVVLLPHGQNKLVLLTRGVKNGSSSTLPGGDMMLHIPLAVWSVALTTPSTLTPQVGYQTWMKYLLFCICSCDDPFF